jgi:phosphoribosylanthranilate isomerase
MTRIKICGITNIDDGMEAARLGADFLGFVFYPPSPRNIAPERAKEILTKIREAFGDRAPRAIGVFVDESPERVRAILDEATLDGAQFSGDESPEVVAELSGVFRIRTLSLETLGRLGRYDVDAYLCDAHDPQRKGGTGKTYDYGRLAPYIERYPLFVAGGLTPAAVQGVVETLRPWGVDCSSALEASPGIKDHARMKEFVEAVRRADATR